MMKNLIANSSQINVKKIHKIILDNFDENVNERLSQCKKSLKDFT